MSSVRGAMIFDCSPDREIDVDGLIIELNKYHWAEAGAWKGKIFDDGTISIMLEDDGGGWLSEHMNLDIYLYELIDEEDEYYDLTLEDISNRFTPYIKNGWIEIAYVSHESIHHIENGSLKIESNGKVIRECKSRYSRSESSHEIETYTPEGEK